MKAQQTGYMVSGGGHVLLLLWGVFAFSNAPPMKLEDSIPVEVVSELPQTTKGEKQAEKPAETPTKKVDVVKPEVKDDDDDDKPIAKEKIKSADSLPPPPPPPKKVEVKAEPPKPAPPKAAPPVKQALAEQDKEDLEDKLAELAAKQKKEKQAKEKAEKDAKEKAVKEAKEKAAKELAAKEAKEAKEAKDAKEKADKDAKERLEARKFDANALAKKLGSAAPLADTRPATSTARTGETLAPKSTAGAQSGRNSTLTASETAAIKEKIEKCWNTASLSINAKNFVVKLQFTMDENGNVTGSPIVTNRQAGAEFAAAAGSAVRAVRGCSPLPVPKNKYEAWKEGINLTFNLADLM